MSTPTAGPVTPERYAKALAGRDPLETLRKAPKRFKKLVKGLTEKEMAWKPAPNRWSVKEVLAHLADGEVILGSRMRFVAAMDNPPIPGYDQDLFVARLGIERIKAKKLLDAFAGMRELNIALLERLPAEAYARSGIHAERGPESIRKMVDMYAGHDILHEQQIERALAERKAADHAKKQAKAEAKAARAAAKSDKKSRKADKKARKAAEHAVVKAKDASDEKTPKKGEDKKEKRKIEALLAGR